MQVSGHSSFFDEAGAKQPKAESATGGTNCNTQAGKYNYSFFILNVHNYDNPHMYNHVIHVLKIFIIRYLKLSIEICIYNVH